MIPRKKIVNSIGLMQNELDLVDIWRVKNPNSKGHTWSKNLQQCFVY